MQWDVIVIGAGPGGMQAAIAGASEGLKVLVLEKDKPGGQIGQTPKLENSVFAGGTITGPAFADMMRQQTLSMGATIREGTAYHMDLTPTLRRVWYAVKGRQVAAEAPVVVLAVGNRWTTLPIHGAHNTPTVHYGPVKTIDFHGAGREVAVYGGGPSAGQAILTLADKTSVARVHALMRSTLKMPQYLVDRIKTHANVQLHEHTKIERVQYHHGLLPTDVQVKSDSGEFTIPVAGLFLCNGLVPDTEWLAGIVPLNNYGQIITQDNVKTEVPGVYAIGDAREGSTPRVGAAIGDGSLAITEAWRYFKKLQVATGHSCLRCDELFERKLATA